MRPASFGAGTADPVRPTSDGDHFRFVVKAPRALNGAIEKLARARGVSAGVLVQQHFERILEHPFPPVAAAPAPQEHAAAAIDVRETAVRLGVTPLAVRVHRAMSGLADGQGNLCAGKAALAAAAGHNGDNGGPIANALVQLEKRGLIKLLEKGNRTRGSTWRIYSIEGRAP